MFAGFCPTSHARIHMRRQPRARANHDRYGCPAESCFEGRNRESNASRPDYIVIRRGLMRVVHTLLPKNC